MKIKESIQNILILAFILVFIISIGIISAIYNFTARNTLKNRLTKSEIPAIIETVTAEVNEKLMKIVSGISVVAEDDFLQEWIVNGEPVKDLPKIINRLNKNSERFNTMGSNVVLWESKNYHDFSNGEYSIKTIGEEDVWFSIFKESGLPFNINAYTNHETIGEVAFINVRIDKDGDFLGIVSVALSLTDFVNTVVNKTIGKDGSTFMIDKKGIVQLHKEKKIIGKEDYSKRDGYIDNFKNITTKENYSFQYKSGNNVIYVNSIFIEELGWYLITEASQNELYKEMNSAAITSTIIVIILTIIGVFIFFILIKNITKPLKYAVNIAETIKNGDLTEEIILERKDEVGKLLHSLKEMKDNLSNIVGSVVEGMQQISSASELLNNENQKLAKRTESQATSLEETSAAIEEMNGSIRSNTENTKEAERFSKTALEKTKEGSEAVSNMINSMNDIDESSNKIAEIIEVINTIAFQTNLLALNASIEAARAGEQGKGFAVVAVEVRKLAKRSDKASSEIAEIIKSSNKKVVDGVAIANNAGEMLNQIKEVVTQVATLIENISTASSEQLTSIEQINQVLIDLDTNTQENSSLADQVASSTEELSAQSVELNDNMRFFKV